MDELTFRSDDGVDVFSRRWLPAGPPQLVVLVAHGMSEHSGRYERLAGVLNEQQYAVYAIDLRGHGVTAKSTGAGRAGAAGFDGVVADLHGLRELAERDNPSVAVVLVGHSMGAMISLAYAERRGAGLAGLVLSGSPGAAEDLRELGAGLRDAAAAGLADEPIPILSTFNAAFEPARTSYDWLSRDASEVDAYVADPLCGDDMPMTYGFLASMMTMATDEVEPGAIASLPAGLPVLLLAGGEDPVSNQGAGVRELEARLRAAGLPVDAFYYAGARHEPFNEINRDEVHADLLAWLAKVRPKS